jgi:predicted metalloprotease with PDZ domain
LKFSSSLAAVVVSAVVAVPHAGAQPPRVEYDISFSNAANHEARVIATFRGLQSGSTLHARMSRSSPGRYALATFAKNVYDVKAADGRGRPLVVTHPDPHGWDLSGHDGTVSITYTVWGDRIDGTYVSIDHSHAHLNMPATFMFARGMDTAPIRLTIHPQPGWQIATQLVPTKDSSVFMAPNLQWFMDSPTEVGPLTFRSWTATYGSKPSTWRLAVHHLGKPSDVDSFVVMARTVVEEAVRVWGEPAGYDLGTYTFIVDYLPWAGGDAMEHRNSTILASSRALSDRAMRLANLGSLSHEFFHSWSMERLRSKSLEPFDFERETMSAELWFGEGFTNYYGPLIIRRAGLYDDEDFARILGGAVVETVMSPARRHFSAAGMSMQAPFFDGSSFLDPTNRQNIHLSYYTWGSVIAFALDLTLRNSYGVTLDDYMRALWRDFGRHQSLAWAPERPYTMRDLRATLGTLVKDTLFANDFFARYIEGSDVPDFTRLLGPGGFLLMPDSVERPYLGASLDNDTASVFVNWSAEGGSLYDAGIASGDEIFAIDGVPTRSIDSLEAIVGRRKPGDRVIVDVKQREVRRKVPMILAGRRSIRFLTYERAGLPVTDSIREYRRRWLGSQR